MHARVLFFFSHRPRKEVSGDVRSEQKKMGVRRRCGRRRRVLESVRREVGKGASVDMNVIKMEDSFVGIEIQRGRYDGANVFYGSRCTVQGPRRGEGREVRE